MIEIDFTRCTGCGACVQSCCAKCISMTETEDGFTYPAVDRSRCTGCGRCGKVCPIGIPTKKAFRQRAYAAVAENADLFRASASGGAFGALAAYVLRESGTIYGCAYTDHATPMHIRVDALCDLPRLQGSKYVQSDTGETFLQAKVDLEAGKLVLYSGTPCQIAGLKAFLGKEYDRLITADLICHGVPSQAYFKKYVEWLEKKWNADIHAVNFREKNGGNGLLSGTYTGNYTGICRDSGRKIQKKLNYFDSYYYSYFLLGDICRNSCYVCKYASPKREGDFTLGDFWGAEGLGVEFSVKKGCSLVLTNTEKAEQLIHLLGLRLEEVPMELAMRHNAQLNHPSQSSLRREELLRQYRELDAEEIQNHFLRTMKRKNFIARVKYSIPEPLKYEMQKLRYRKMNKRAYEQE